MDAPTTADKLQITKEKNNPGQINLSITVDAAVVERHLRQERSKVAGRLNIPGFRKGKAPASVIDRHYGKERLLEDSITPIANEIVPQAAEQEGLEITYPPSVSVKTTDPLVIEAIIPLKPSVKINDYSNIRLDEASPEITEGQVLEAIQNLQAVKTEWKESEGPAVLGDLVTIVSEGLVQGEGAEAEFLSKRERSYLAADDNPNPIKGFAEQLAGMNIGETRTFVLTVPEEHPKVEFVGREVKFSVTLQDIKRKEVPEADDDFAKSLGNSEVQTSEEMQEFVRKSLSEKAESKWKSVARQKVVDQLIDLAEFDISPVLIDRETRHLLEERQTILSRNNIPYEEYLKQADISAEEDINRVRKSAENRLKASLAIREFADAEGIEPDREKAEQEFASLEGEEKKVAESDPERIKIAILENLRENAALERLVEIAVGKVDSST